MDANEKRRPWWAVGLLLALGCLGFIWTAYWFSWPGTGFAGKTLWDWLQLLIIPLALAFEGLSTIKRQMRDPTCSPDPDNSQKVA